MSRDNVSFKFAYCTIRWRDPDLEPALEEVRKAGWDGWEGRLSLDQLGPPARLRRICKNVGLPLAVLSSDALPERRDPEGVERNMRRIDYAAEMEVDCFMAMSGLKPEGRQATEEDLRRVAEGAEALADYAAQYALDVCYHIHTNTPIDSKEDLAFFMRQVDKTRLCIDVSHAQLWGYDPSDAIRDYRNELDYVHLQDFASSSRAEDGTYIVTWADVGEAQNVDFPDVLATLEAVGFSRWIACCPGEPFLDDPRSDARRSKGMRAYLGKLGY